MPIFKKAPDPTRPEIASVSSWHEFTLPDIDGEPRAMADFAGKIVLVVNTASKCGLTTQYAALQSIFEKYDSQGLVVLGFPCNDFLRQEPAGEQRIKEFCATKYRIGFPMFSKVHVKGLKQSAMYAWLVAKTGGHPVEWNFAKFMIGRDGEVLARFHPRVTPDDPQFVQAIEDALATK